MGMLSWSRESSLFLSMKLTQEKSPANMAIEGRASEALESAFESFGKGEEEEDLNIKAFKVSAEMLAVMNLEEFPSPIDVEKKFVGSVIVGSN